MSRRPRLALAAAVLAVAATVFPVVPAAPALAHTALSKASPAKGTVVSSVPAVVLTFGDPVMVPRVELLDAAGSHHESGRPRSVDNVVTLPVGGKLAGGVYTVSWRVVSPDGHPISGQYTFTVKGGAGAPAQAPAAAPVSGAAGTEPAESSAGWLWLGLVGLAGVAVAGGVALLRRRRTAG